MDESGADSNSTSFVFQSPNSGSNLQDTLTEAFESERDYTRLRILAATVSMKGIVMIEDELRQFCEDGGDVVIYIGLSMGPDLAAVRRLRIIQDDYPGLVSVNLIENGGEIKLFHPKVYWFQSESGYCAIVGSPNWSDRGLNSSVEAMVVRRGVFDEKSTDEFVESLMTAFDEIGSLNDSAGSWGTLYPPSEEVLSDLENNVPEARRGVDQAVSVSIDVDPSNSLWPLNRNAPILLIQLNKESRFSQILPPKDIWEEYFGVNSDLFYPEVDRNLLPNYDLRNVKTGEIIQKPVVPHDHQGSVDIPEAREGYRDDPSEQAAYLIFKRTGRHSFDYELFLEGDDPETDEIAEFLDRHGYYPGRSSKSTYLYMGNEMSVHPNRGQD